MFLESEKSEVIDLKNLHFYSMSALKLGIQMISKAHFKQWNLSLQVL